MTTLIRVFPRRNKATPDDELAFVGDPPLFRPLAERAESAESEESEEVTYVFPAP